MNLYTLILSTHILTALVLMVTVIYADHLAFNWLRGSMNVLPKEKMHHIHNGIYAGIGIMGATGLYMFLPLQDFLLYETAFQLKMGFLATLIINSFFIKKLMDISTEHSFAELGVKTKLLFLLSGGVSAICWIGVLTAATQLGV